MIVRKFIKIIYCCYWLTLNIPFLHSFTTLYLRGIRNRKQKEIDSVILMIDYSKFCLFYNVKVFEKNVFSEFYGFFGFLIFLIFWDFLGFFGIFSKKSEGVRGFFRVDNPSTPPQKKGWVVPCITMFHIVIFDSFIRRIVGEKH